MTSAPRPRANASTGGKQPWTPPKRPKPLRLKFGVDPVEAKPAAKPEPAFDTSVSETWLNRHAASFKKMEEAERRLEQAAQQRASGAARQQHAGLRLRMLGLPAIVLIFGGLAWHTRDARSAGVERYNELKGDPAGR